MTPTVVVRRIAATPARSATEAWSVIVDLLAPPSGAARNELDGTSGIGASLIAAETMRDSPIVVSGVGPRLRIYCLFDELAILGDGASENPLAFWPTDGDWTMSIPCPPEDLDWVRAALATRSTRITARDMGEKAGSEAEQPAQATERGLGPLDKEAFLRP